MIEQTINYRDYKISKLPIADYPLLLGSSIFRPNQLYYKGALPTSEATGIAMVGTRRPSSSAKKLCDQLVQSLKGTQAVSVSVLAQGIDSYCHEAALDAGIPTIAVIAQGLNVPIPGDRADLANRILRHGGAIISEYEADFPSFKGTFPARNRIISGLSKSTVLIQSKLKGGALITANLCLKEGKPLLAVPGDFDSDVAAGPNSYLDQGKAKPIFLPESLRTLVGLTLTDAPSISIKGLERSGCKLSKEARDVFYQFNGYKKTFSQIQEESNLLTGNILAILTELEIAGLVETHDNFQFYFNGSN